MEACLQQYIPGAIIEYTAPYPKPTCQKLGIPSSRPVLIVGVSPAHPASDVQAMILTTSLNYYGFKIFMNTLNPKTRKMSTICPNKIYTIERKYLGAILGFITPSLLEKCRQAYAYEIGLTDKAPPYYTGDSLCSQYMSAGEVRIPQNPEAFRSHDDMTPKTYIEANIAFDAKMITAGTDGARKCGKTYIELMEPQDLAVEPVKPDLIDKEEPATEESSNEAEKHEHEPVEFTITDPTEDEHKPEEERSQEPKIGYGGPVSMADIRARSSSGKITAELKAAIESRQYEAVSISQSMKEMAGLLTDDERYDIFTYRMSTTAVARRLDTTAYTAKKVMTYVINGIVKTKNDLIEGVLNGTFNLKFIGERQIVAFSLMSLDEIRDIKMGVATYHSYAKLYNLKRTLISELQVEGLL